MNLTIQCRDANTGRLLSHGSYKITHSNSKNFNEKDKEWFIVDAKEIIKISNIESGYYLIQEIDEPYVIIEIEDEEFSISERRYEYELKQKPRRFYVGHENKEVVLEYLIKTVHPDIETDKKSINKKNFEFQEKRKIFNRSHVLNDCEFKDVSKPFLRIAIVLAVFSFLWLVPYSLTGLLAFCATSVAGIDGFNIIMNSYAKTELIPFVNYFSFCRLVILNPSIISVQVVLLGIVEFIVVTFFPFIIAYVVINHFNRPKNRVLDKIPKPVKKGPNAGIYGSSKIERDKKKIKKVVSTTNRLNEIEVNDPGVYCGYYACSTWQRIINIYVDWRKTKGKQSHFLKKQEGTYCYIPDDCHAIIYGDTRAGKTRRVLLSTLHLISRGKKESFIIFDSKRELLAFTSERLKREGYEIKVYDFEHPENSTRHNPLYVAIKLYKQGKDAEMNQEVSERVESLFDPMVTRGENKFFYEGAKNIIKAATLAVICDPECPEEQKTFGTVSRLVEDMFSPCPIDAKRPNQGKYIPFEEYIDMKFPYDSAVAETFGLVKTAEEKHIKNFISTAQTGISIFRDPLIAEMTSITENEFSNIARKKQAVFIIAPSNKQAYKMLATMFLDQMYSELRSEANNEDVVNGHKVVGRTFRRVNFICEEILSINPWAKLMDALNEGAGLGLRFFLIVQNQTLFNEKYGRENAEGIKPNCAVQMLITTGDTEATVKHWSKVVGTMTVEGVSKVSAGSKIGFKLGASNTKNAVRRACLDEAEIQAWNADCGILVKTKLCENVLNIPLPDVSCTETEKYFGLGSKAQNMEKAAAILQQRFGSSGFKSKTKTNWLPGIPNATEKKYSETEIKDFIRKQTKRYISNYQDRHCVADKNKKEEIKKDKKTYVFFNDKTGEHIYCANNQIFEEEIHSMKYSIGEGWRHSTFKNEALAKEEIHNFQKRFKNHQEEVEIVEMAFA